MEAAVEVRVAGKERKMKTTAFLGCLGHSTCRGLVGNKGIHYIEVI